MRSKLPVPVRNTISGFLLATLSAVAPAQENVWTSHGPTDVGYVYDVAVGDSVAYAATPNGIFRSSDGAATWQQSGLAGESIFQILARPGAAVALALVWSPELEAGVLYASRDEGNTWAPVAGLPTTSVAAIDPWHLSTIYAGGRDGTIWASTDAGASWQQVSTTPTGSWAQTFEFDSSAIYMRSFDDSDNLYKYYRSLDAGASWAVVQSPLVNLAVLEAGAAPGIIYAWGSNSICRSADSASTWTCSAFPRFPAHIVELPGSPPRVLAGSLDGVYVSGDGGQTWDRRADFGSIGSYPGLATDGSGSLVLAGTPAGILRSQDRGDSWTAAGVGLRSSLINALALDPQNPYTVWASDSGSPNSGLFRSADGGFSWSPAGGPGNPIYSRALVNDPEDPSTLYAGGGSAVYRSDDGGAHWTSASLPGLASVSALAADPGSPERVWAASYDGLFRSDDGAQSFTSPAVVAQEIYCILFDGKRPGTLYVGSYFDVEPGFYGYPFGGAIFASQDGGANWTKSEHDVGSQVYALALDPFQGGVLYAGTPNGVFRSADDGATWEAPAQGSKIGRVHSLVADPLRPGRIYAATDFAVYRTTDAARTWHPFSSGLGHLPPQALVITPDGRWLHVGTNGGGVFELNLADSLPCSQSATRLCLVGNRYAVDLVASRPGSSEPHLGAAQRLGDRAGYFGLPFATGDPALPEVAVKMLADGAFGARGAPVFYSSLTTLPYSLTVTDTLTGKQEVYASNRDEPLCGDTDLPFGAAEASAALRSGTVAAGEPALRLLGGRFSVTLEARHPRDGRIASGVVMPSGDRFGFFSLPEFTGDPQFPEVVVKMVDYRAISGKFWFFHTGLTSLEYTLTVTDSVTGAVRIYDSASSFCGAADTQAFSDAMPVPSLLDLSGAWDGTISSSPDCSNCTSPEGVHVTLSHVGNVVAGHFSTDCLGEIELRGTLDGDRLTFDLPFFESISGRFTGSATPTTISVDMDCDPWGYLGDHTTRLRLSR